MRLRTQGERIVAAAPPVSGYGRRGLLEFIAGQPLEDALVVLERACAHTGQGYRLALTLATERAARITAPRAAQLLRVFFAELEMTLSALWSLTELTRALNLRTLRAEGLEQRERIYDAAEAATGQRVYWAIAHPGGVREGIELSAVGDLVSWLREVVAFWHAALGPKGALRRAAERVDARQVKAPGAEAAAGNVPAVPLARDDARRATPYDGYRAITVDWTLLDDTPGGVAEAMSCALRLITRLKLSHDIMRVCAEGLSDVTPGSAPAPLMAGRGSATIQTAHGPARLDLTLSNDLTVASIRLVTSCAAALADAPRWLPGRTLADAPTALASLDLCPSCADL